MNVILNALKTFTSTPAVRFWLAKTLVALGIGVVSYTGFSAAWNTAKTALMTNYAGLPADVLSILALAKVPNAINVVISAFATRLVLLGLDSSGVLKKLTFRSGSTGSVL